MDRGNIAIEFSDLLAVLSNWNLILATRISAKTMRLNFPTCLRCSPPLALAKPVNCPNNPALSAVLVWNRRVSTYHGSIELEIQKMKMITPCSPVLPSLQPSLRRSFSLNASITPTAAPRQRWVV